MGELRVLWRSCLAVRDSATPTADLSRDACSGGAEGAADAPRWRSCRAAPPRLRPMACIPGWVCGRRCWESLHPSSSAVVRLVPPGRRTKQRSAHQLLRGSARWSAVPRRWGPAAGGADRVCSRSRIGGVTDDVVIVGSPSSCQGMSQTSQAHAHRRGMDISRNSTELLRSSSASCIAGP